MATAYFATVTADNGETFNRAYQSPESALRFINQKLRDFDRQGICASGRIDIQEVEVVA